MIQNWLLLQAAYLIRSQIPELTTYQHVYRKEKHCKIITVLAFDLNAGNSLSKPGTLREGLHFQYSKKEKRKKKGGKASIMFTGHTAFLRIKLFCKEKLFIERSHLSNYSVCNNH